MAKPKLALIPATQGSKLYSVLPADGVGDFDFSRGSAATRINKDGLIETVASGVSRLNYPLIDGKVVGCPSHLLEPSRLQQIQYSEAFDNAYWTKSGAGVQGDPSTAGAEEVTNGDFATDTDWTKGAGTTISSGLLNHTGGPTDTEQIISISEKLYKIEYTIVSGSGSVRFWSNIGSYTNTQTGVGTYVSYFYYDSSIGTDGRFAMNLTNDISIDNVSVKEVQGYSSPSGDLSAFKLVEGTANEIHRITSSNIITTDGVEITQTIFVKNISRNWIRLRSTITSTTPYVFYNLSNNTIGSTSNASGTIETLGNGYKRLSITYTASGINNNLELSLSQVNDNNLVAYQGDGTSGVYIFGAQLEQGSFPTSYIPNYGTSAGITRSAETANGAGDASTFNDSEGVLMAEISNPKENTNLVAIGLSNGSSSNTVVIFYYLDRVYMDIQNTGTYTSGYVNGIDTSNSNKIALKYKSGNISMFFNGYEILTSTNSITLNGLNRINFDYGDGSLYKFEGSTKQIQYYDSALNDSDLEKITSWTSFTDLANGQTYSIK